MWKSVCCEVQGIGHKKTMFLARIKHLNLCKMVFTLLPWRMGQGPQACRIMVHSEWSKMWLNT